MKKNKSEKKQTKRTGKTSKPMEDKTPKPKTLGQEDYYEFRPTERWVDEPKEIASMSDGELFSRFRNRRRDWGEFSKEEEAGLALIYRLQQDFKKPIERLKLFLRGAEGYRLEPGDKNQNLYKSERRKIIKQFLLEVGVLPPEAPPGKKKVVSDEKLQALYLTARTGLIICSPDARPFKMSGQYLSPEGARDKVAKDTGLSPRQVYERLKAMGNKSIPNPPRK